MSGVRKTFKTKLFNHLAADAPVDKLNELMEEQFLSGLRAEEKQMLGDVKQKITVRGSRLTAMGALVPDRNAQQKAKFNKVRKRELQKPIRDEVGRIQALTKKLEKARAAARKVEDEVSEMRVEQAAKERGPSEEKDPLSDEEIKKRVEEIKANEGVRQGREKALRDLKDKTSEMKVEAAARQRVLERRKMEETRKEQIKQSSKDKAKERRAELSGDRSSKFGPDRLAFDKKERQELNIDATRGGGTGEKAEEVEAVDFKGIALRRREEIRKKSGVVSKKSDEINAALRGAVSDMKKLGKKFANTPEESFKTSKRGTKVNDALLEKVHQTAQEIEELEAEIEIAEAEEVEDVALGSGGEKRGGGELEGRPDKFSAFDAEFHDAEFPKQPPGEFSLGVGGAKAQDPKRPKQRVGAGSAFPGADVLQGVEESEVGETQPQPPAISQGSAGTMPPNVGKATSPPAPGAADGVEVKDAKGKVIDPGPAGEGEGDGGDNGDGKESAPKADAAADLGGETEGDGADGRDDLLSPDEAKTLTRDTFHWQVKDTKYYKRADRGKMGYGQGPENNVQPIQPFGVGVGLHAPPDHTQNVSVFKQSDPRFEPFRGQHQIVTQKESSQESGLGPGEDIAPVAEKPFAKVSGQIIWLPYYASTVKFFFTHSDFEELVANVIEDGKALKLKAPEPGVMKMMQSSVDSVRKALMSSYDLPQVRLRHESLTTRYAEWLELKQIMKAISKYQKTTSGMYQQAGMFSGNLREAVTRAIDEAVQMSGAKRKRQLGRGLEGSKATATGQEKKDERPDFQAYNPFQTNERELKRVRTTLPRFF